MKSRNDMGSIQNQLQYLKILQSYLVTGKQRISYSKTNLQTEVKTGMRRVQITSWGNVIHRSLFPKMRNYTDTLGHLTFPTDTPRLRNSIHLDYCQRPTEGHENLSTAKTEEDHRWRTART